MNQFGGEPSLEDLLEDPIIQAVMKADGFDQATLRGLLARAAAPDAALARGEKSPAHCG